VHSVTPKSGLLSILASYLTRVPVRIHTFTGQVWATKNGLSKKILKWLDYLISSLATTVIIDSHSQRNFLIKNKIIKENNSIVLGNGSISGVNHERFRIDLLLRKKIRSDLKISDDTVIFLYLGRIKKEKGVLDLLEAFSLIKEKYKNTRLLIVGPDEDFLASIIKKQDKVSLFPYTQNPEEFMNASDVFCLPSYREGFGSVIIEAGACGIPSIGTKIYGLTDAIKDNLTGILISLKSINELEKAMEVMILDSKVRSDMGKAAYEYSIRRFSQENITKKLISLYSNLLQSKPKK
jgi:glycosyltransferase involved in cell wall biosynthesis